MQTFIVKNLHCWIKLSSLFHVAIKVYRVIVVNFFKIIVFLCQGYKFSEIWWFRYLNDLIDRSKVCYVKMFLNQLTCVYVTSDRAEVRADGQCQIVYLLRHGQKVRSATPMTSSKFEEGCYSLLLYFFLFYK